MKLAAGVVCAREIDGTISRIRSRQGASGAVVLEAVCVLAEGRRVAWSLASLHAHARHGSPRIGNPKRVNATSRKRTTVKAECDSQDQTRTVEWGNAADQGKGAHCSSLVLEVRRMGSLRSWFPF